MEFRIADTFTGSLTRLIGEEQKAVKTTAFDLQVNPANPGMQLHRIDRAKDKGFWSVRVNRDLRLIIHRSDSRLVLCYVGHHDEAYKWAACRKLERHPRTGAAQLVELRETFREIEIPRYVEASYTGTPASHDRVVLADVSDDELLSYGVPTEWLSDVRGATEDELLDIADHLPPEAAEALMTIAAGGAPEPPVQAAVDADPFDHPDAQRRFRVMTSVAELERALDYPWEKWTVFLHPAQRSVVERGYSGPARVSGSAGTGKTVVALHRAVHLVRSNPGAKVLLTTFSENLARALELKLSRLVGEDQRVLDCVTVSAIDRVGFELYEGTFGEPSIANEERIRTLLRRASEAGEAHRFSERFLEIEWHAVVDAWQIASWEAYRDVPRLGRKTRIGERQRRILWSIFEQVRSELVEQELVTLADVFARLAEHVTGGGQAPFDFAVIDEAQDVSVPQLRFLAALAGERENGLFFAGDLGQRIFQTPFSWRSLGVDVRGRSSTLRINYRTSHQIRRQADRLLPPELSDVDGNKEARRGTVSAFNGPEPSVRVLQSVEKETNTIAEWLTARRAEGIRPEEIAVIVRTTAELDRARAAIEMAGLRAFNLDADSAGREGCVSICTMHLAKGLEFRAVAVAACDDDVVPLQSRIEAIADDADLEDVYNTEQHLLYVACTRAREYLFVTGVTPASEFLDDLRVPVLGETRS